MIAYGARCTWWDDKAKVGQLGSGLPCCPKCNGVLFELEEEKFNNIPDGFDMGGLFRNAEEYKQFLAWDRGKCFPNFEIAVDTWREELANA